MKRIGFIVGALLLFSSMAYGETAKATVYNAQGKEIGNATFTEDSEGVKMSLRVGELTPGLHGFHIHAVGRCEEPDFKSAGGHFNPLGRKHGSKNPEGAHGGDLQNLSVEPDGTAHVEWIVQGVTLRAGENSLFHPDGTSLVIHADPDDEMTDPSGNSGARVACGVITR